MLDRKNVDCLNTDELHDLREALAAMYAAPASDPFSFALIASFHGGPPTAYCAHGAPGFFTWHRAYLLAFENALRVHGCKVSLPYWDWSSGPSTGVPAACRAATYVNRAGATVANPLYSGPRPGGGQTARGANIDSTSFDVHASSAQTAMSASTFASFQSQVNGVHGSVHVAVGGDMSSVPSAGFDPIFYLHHANIDRLWANWQASHPGALPASEASFALLPFNRPYSASYYTGADMESTSALGYRYRNFCFFLPPFRVWEVVKVRWPLALARRVPSARLVLKSHHMQPAPVEFRVFINQPGADSKTPLSPEAGFAGLAASFGHGPADPHGQHPKVDKAQNADEHAAHRPPPQAGVKERFDLEIDITKALAEAGARSEELSLKVVAVDGQGGAVPDQNVLLEEAVIALE